MDLKEPGNFLYLIGTTYRDLGASEYASLKDAAYEGVPTVRSPADAIKSYRSLHRAITAGLARSCHDLSDGGLAVALAEMCLAGEAGAALDLATVPQEGCTLDAEVLYSESPCRILVEVAPDKAQTFEKELSGTAVARVGEVRKGDMIDVSGLGGGTVLSVSRIDCKTAWKSTLNF
jgi:phosphoribosylformylglycinamidine synthase